MFAVPQVSMRLADISRDHARMLTDYLEYWRANRTVLLDGDLAPEGIRGNYDLGTTNNPGAIRPKVIHCA